MLLRSRLTVAASTRTVLLSYKTRLGTDVPCLRLTHRDAVTSSECQVASRTSQGEIAAQSHRATNSNRSFEGNYFSTLIKFCIPTM
ncbi:hypothetical protein SETIT_2G190300v2 [Setaria italica]|uniref:Uncharacterized protein n=1 Tax=Setaria italica TaxID=4555 RepID=A0A368Q116_SETIT|nr:hypothetical protein SETIT_2G190300v2 [Setaria italica]